MLTTSDDPALHDRVVRSCLELGLVGVAAHLTSLVAQAEENQWTYEQFLLAVLEAEMDHRRKIGGRAGVSAVSRRARRPAVRPR